MIMVMRTTLSKKEFAAALGMKENDLFVQKMFNIVDKDGDNRISFQVRMVKSNYMRGWVISIKFLTHFISTATWQLLK